ncbi:ATP-dependent DNA helicase RecG [Gordonia amarae]|uniref:ATP-dependent DNA helicase RecG n=2 Tax=Gordonia amarae TaxID=36821 RepID=G7GK31_9ACTN|nr:ATP-dependent DNA helicase RecG [Gordonia amarae]QHN18235.1 ATP-dependent DNA helicase RecG [Gordonia amarae]QHN22719.1 ATP-dependent DNA helicase RecG [Gordonia amarae]QHN31622.1 ATP-dependent DNA helicase RecG [Gordonia amarae]QHN40366.1 ATP-dependent DNA helicase RecG [Gordonia amarae]GAB03956.1 ATP-dependent DNA helicase RecG [Gordonia amarae NBRC 15530]
MVSLQDSPGVLLDKKTTAGLASLNITTVGELLRYPPRRYMQQGHLDQRERLEAGEWTTVVGTITASQMISMKRKHGQFLKVVVDDGHQRVEATFFNPRAIRRALQPGARVMLAGKVKYFREQVQLSHPQWAVIPDGDGDAGKVVGSAMAAEMYTADTELAEEGHETAAFDRPIIPMYPASSEIQTWTIWNAVRRVLAQLPPQPDVLDDAWRRSRGLLTADEALRKIHLPDTEDDITAARERLKFDEALAIQTVLAQRRIAGHREQSVACPPVSDGLEAKLLQRLPFELTDGQKEVVAEIGDDLASTAPMSRLLQGEVGSGKTLVSLLTMLRVVDNGHQCVLMAPTEVLAAQHYRTIRSMLGDLAEAGELTAAEGATKIALLTGSMKTKGKRQTLLDVVTGEAGIVIGTHALLEEKVSFFDLGMVVVDEQHRFGVEQRDVLRGRGKDGVHPHFLVMTATPIPRTVAMTAFGDLDTSTLRELPRGRQPISTTVVPMGSSKWVDRVWERAAEEIASGRQVYVVCSRIGDDGPEEELRKIEDDPALRTTSVLDMFEELSSGPLGGHSIEMLHGRMPPDEKNFVMDRFGAGDVDIVVSTTVIEVGVDVPNATMMVIIDADRFGVSQLHQLRGRVGRGEHAGLCLLLTTANPVSQSMERLKAVAGSNDGFELARIDLQQRREGDVLGSLQSGGKSSLHFLSLLDDADVIADARELAEEVVSMDLPLADHRPLADLVDGILAPQKVAYLDKS